MQDENGIRQFWKRNHSYCEQMKKGWPANQLRFISKKKKDLELWETIDFELVHYSALRSSYLGEYKKPISRLLEKSRCKSCFFPKKFCKAEAS